MNKSTASVSEKKIEVSYTQTGTDNATGNVDVKISGNSADDEFKSFMDALKADNVVYGNEIAIEKNNGSLTINGTKQTAETIQKYASFLKEGKNFNFKISSKD